MKNFALALLLTASFGLAGCGFFDGLILEQATTEDGQELFLDEEDKLTTEPTDPDTGEPNRPAYKSGTSDEFNQLTEVAADASGPFAPLVVGLLGLFGTVYSSVRGRKKLKAEKVVGDLLKKLTSVALRIYDDYRQGIIDANDDGVISLEEAKKYALESGVPVGAVVDMLDIVQKGFSPTEAQKKLEELVDKYGK